MQHIPLSAWPRREAAAFFGALDFPFYSVSWRADVTRLRAAAKRDGLSFYLSMVYEVTAALGEVDAFLYKLRGDTVVRHERLSPSFTVPAPGGNFKIVSVDAVPGETRPRRRSFGPQTSAAGTFFLAVVRQCRYNRQIYQTPPGTPKNFHCGGLHHVFVSKRCRRTRSKRPAPAKGNRL